MFANIRVIIHFILRKSWQVFHDRLLLGRCFKGFVLPVLEYCSAVLCSAADTHLRLLDRVVSGASFLNGGVFACDLAHRRSVSVYLPPVVWGFIIQPTLALVRVVRGD